MSFLKQWRFWLSLFLIGFCFYFIQPNFNSKNSDFKLNFGLDIQGGYSYLLELNENEFRQNLLIKTVQALESSYGLQSDISNKQIFISSDQNIDLLNNLTIQSLGFEIIERNDNGVLIGLLEQNFNQSLSEKIFASPFTEIGTSHDKPYKQKIQPTIPPIRMTGPPNKCRI